MKKAIYFFICCMMLCPIVGVSAEELLTVEKTVDYENRKIHINVIGDNEVNYYNLIVLKPGVNSFNETNVDETIFFAKQQKSRSFTLNFPQNFSEADCGLYKFTVSGSDFSQGLSDSFYLTTVENYNNIQPKLNTISDVELYKEHLNNNKYIIGLEDNDYTSDEWTVPVQTVLNIRTEAGNFEGFDDFIAAFERAKKVCEINTANETTVENLLKRSQNLLNIDIGTDSFYAGLDNDKQRQEVCDIFLLNSPYATDKLLSKGFAEAVFLTRINNSFQSGFKNILTSYCGTVSLADITGFTDDELTTLFNGVTVNNGQMNDDYTDIDIFANKFNLIVGNIISNRGNGGSVGGGNSGNSGSSGGSGGIGGGSIGSAASNIQPSVSVPVTNNTFTDLKNFSWAEEAIYYLADENIINGYDGKVFKPENNITREEFLKILVETFDFDLIRETSIMFDDADENEWYYPYVKIAYAAGITTGKTSNVFGISENITRQDMAVMLNRCIKLKNIELSAEKIRTFIDDKDISSYAKDSIYALSSAGIINGFDDGSYKPYQNATRAEAAQLIYHTIKIID